MRRRKGGRKGRRNGGREEGTEGEREGGREAKVWNGRKNPPYVIFTANQFGECLIQGFCRVWFRDREHRHHLGTCQNSDSPGPALDPPNQKPGARGPAAWVLTVLAKILTFAKVCLLLFQLRHVRFWVTAQPRTTGPKSSFIAAGVLHFLSLPLVLTNLESLWENP